MLHYLFSNIIVVYIIKSKYVILLFFDIIVM